jgi:hypothetical protein
MKWLASSKRQHSPLERSLGNLPLDGKDYLLCYMRTESIQKAHEVVQSSPHAIDAYHQQFKQDAWVAGKSARLLVDLVNDNLP